MVVTNTPPKTFLSDRIIGHAAVGFLFIMIGFQLPRASILGVGLAYCGALVLFETVVMTLESKDIKTLRILAVCVAVVGTIIALSAPGVF